MKTCPVCHAKAFEDAEICFGCLHDFGNSTETAAPISTDETPPEFRITFTPTRSQSGAIMWKCAIET